MPQEPSASNWKDTLANKLQHFFDDGSRDDYHFNLSSPYETSDNSSFIPTTEQLQENEKNFEVKEIFPSLRSFFRVYKG